jgi:hypothetical protein
LPTSVWPPEAIPDTRLMSSISKCLQLLENKSFLYFYIHPDLIEYPIKRPIINGISQKRKRSKKIFLFGFSANKPGLIEISIALAPQTKRGNTIIRKYLN